MQELRERVHHLELVGAEQLRCEQRMENHHNLSMYLFETAKSGQVYRFIVIPDMLKNAPMFKRLDARIKGKGASLGVGRGRAVAIRAKAQAAGRGVAPGRGVPPVRR